MRKCWKCNQDRRFEDYPFRNRMQGIRQNTCKLCVRENSKKWFLENRERAYEKSRPAVRKWHKKRKIELHEIVDKLKNKPCMDCQGSFNHWVMQFDHRDGNTKRDNVATMLHETRPLDAILLEIDKCDLVCANCHAERTHRRRTGT